MEEIQIHEEKKKELITLFSKRRNMWIPLFVIGLIGFLPAIIASFTILAVSSYPSSVIFFVIGFTFWAQSNEAIKKIENDGYKVYKAKCRKISSAFGYVWVENNELLSKKAKKPFNKI